MTEAPVPSVVAAVMVLLPVLLLVVVVLCTVAPRRCAPAARLMRSSSSHLRPVDPLPSTSRQRRRSAQVVDSASVFTSNRCLGQPRSTRGASATVVDTRQGNIIDCRSGPVGRGLFMKIVTQYAPLHTPSHLSTWQQTRASMIRLTPLWQLQLYLHLLVQAKLKRCPQRVPLPLWLRQPTRT